MTLRQLDLAALPAGTYANTGQAARDGRAVNRFCYDLKEPGNRRAFLDDPEAEMERCGLAPEIRQLIREHDWLGLIQRGANIFPLIRLSMLCGDNLEATGAQMRGESLEEYLTSRGLSNKDSE
jgi:hypothetical protein